MTLESPSHEAEDLGHIVWPTREEVLDSFDLVKAYQEAVAVLTESDLLKLLTPLPSSALRNVLVLIGMSDAAKVNAGMARALHSRLRKSADRSLLNRPFRPWTGRLHAHVMHGTDVDADLEAAHSRREWLKFLGHGESALHVHADNQLIPIGSAIAELSTLGSAVPGILLAAIESEPAPVPVMALAATLQPNLAEAYEQLRGAFPDIPSMPDPFSTYVASEKADVQAEPAGEPEGPLVIEDPESTSSDESDPLVEAAAALDWTGATQAARRVLEHLDAERAPNDNDLARLQGFVNEVREVAEQLGAAVGEVVELNASALNEALARRAAQQDPTIAVLRAMTLLAGPAEKSESINQVKQLSLDAIESLEPTEVVAGLVALHDLAQAGIAKRRGTSFDWSSAMHWQRLVVAGLPSETHDLTMVAAAGDLIPADPEAGERSRSGSDDSVESAETGAGEGPAHEPLADVEEEPQTDSDPVASTAEAIVSPTETPPAPSSEAWSSPALTGDATSGLIPEAESEFGDVPEKPSDAPDRKDAVELKAPTATVSETDFASPESGTVPRATPPTIQIDESEVSVSTLGGELPADPWHEPSPSLHAQLIATGRDALSVHLAELREPEAARTKALRVFAGAFGVQAERFILSLPDLAPDAVEIGALQMDEARVFLAGQLRLALELGYSPIGNLETLREQAGFEGSVGDVVAEAIALSTRGYQRRPDEGGFNLPAQWRSVADEAEERLNSLSTRSISYQRSSKIIHYLARDNQKLGRALRTVATLADAQARGASADDGEWTWLRDLISQLRRQGGVARVINEADREVSTSQQRRNPIVADASAKLQEAVEDVATLLERAFTLRSVHESSVQANPGIDDTRMLALATSASVDHLTTAGNAAAWRLICWLRDLTNTRSAEFVSLTDMLEESLDAAYEIPRNADGRISRKPTDVELAQVITGRAPSDVIRGYLQTGNRLAAINFSAVHGEQGPREDQDEIQRSLSVLRRRHDDALARADRVVARLQSLGEDETARGLLGRIDLFRTAVEDRFDLSLGPLDAAAHDGETALESARTELRRRAEGLPEADHARIIALLDGEAEPLAVEYLSLAEAGEDLPTVEPPSGDDFAEFFPSFVERAMDNQGAKSRTVTLVRAAIGASTQPSNPVLAEGMKAWVELATHQQGGEPALRIRRISGILRMLGLIPQPDPRLRDVTKTRRAGYATFSVRANPIGGASYVPSLGSQAQGVYNLTAVWQEVSPSRLLQLVDEDLRSQANIIFYFGTLSVEQRLELRKLTSRPGTDYSPLVIDDAVVAWLTTQPEAGWKVTQRVSLPFTTINPYTPFAGGEVPAEMFVGREVERRRIVDPTGPMFVYGGRQLGKSALLRRIERGMSRGSAGADDDNVVVYIDLKAAGIGDASPASALWQALAPKLVDAGVLEPQRTWTADAVIAGVSTWLNKDDSRRLLLLLDEADNFLTTDARETGTTGLGSFPTLQRLKGLMEQSARRFKPVFAGLHQVQRFHALPNTPVAHGGQDILIGPLRPVDAQQLVRDPLLALGYRFENDETMWRLLLFTNYQASLIQIMCEALTRHVRKMALPSGGGRVVITDKHVDEVYSDREVRELIAQRFRWTINLDSRYRMIALVTAFRSFDSAPGETFSAAELQRECEDYWPAGFAKANLSSSEFMRYLEEMTGLGVLHRQGDEFGLRSPNIRGLLGSMAEIEEELIEASRTFDVAYEYNPAVNRRLLESGNTATQRRSPLADSDLGKLLVGTHVVVGTPALGIERVLGSLELVARERQMDLLTHLPANRHRGRLHVLRLTEADDLIEIYHRVLKTEATCVLVGSPEQVLPHVGVIASTMMQLRRWTLTGLQSWPETPFQTPGLRSDLMRVTGGWPELVELAMKHVHGGVTPADALTRVKQSLAEPAFADALISSVGLSQTVLVPWMDWFADFDDSGRVRSHAFKIDDLEAAGLAGNPEDIFTGLELRDVLDQTPEGWAMEPTVLMAARSALGSK